MGSLVELLFSFRMQSVLAFLQMVDAITGKVISSMVIAPAGCLYPKKKNCGKCQSGIINHPIGRNAVIITYCTGNWLASVLFRLVLITVT
jgi:hypothetical protein